MSTGIEWTDETWNPVVGCTHVSEGCDNCYAERITNRFGGPGAFDTVVLHPERLDQPFHWRKPRRVFVNSMSDLFHNDVPTLFIGRVFNVMGANPQHTFQVLTKRPGAMAAMLRAYYDVLGVEPFPNVWLGTSVEDQRWADVRIPKLLETPAAVRFLSCEPLLGPVDLDAAGWVVAEGRSYLTDYGIEHDAEFFPGIDWVIVGGESGPGARPMDLDWARAIRDECTGWDVPFFLKQLGGHPDKRGHNAAVLDGRRWDEFPEAVSVGR